MGPLNCVIKYETLVASDVQIVLWKPQMPNSGSLARQSNSVSKVD